MERKSLLKKILSVFTAGTLSLSLMLGIPFGEFSLGITVSAVSDSENLVFDVSEGNISIGAEAITYGGDKSVKYTTGDEITITGETTSYTVTVEENVPANITLSNVNIDVSNERNTAAFKIADNSTKNVNITLVGDNALKSGRNCAGLQKNGSGDSIGWLTISGTGSLTASGGKSIGGEEEFNSSNIAINGGTITAENGIGGNSWEPEEQGANIVINGGSVKARFSHDDTIKDGSGNPVYLLELTFKDSSSIKSVKIDGKDYPACHGTEGKLYVYLTGESHDLLINGNVSKHYEFKSENEQFLPQGGGFDISPSTLEEGNDYTYEDGVLNILSEKPITIKNADQTMMFTTDTIQVESGVSANITLDGVCIDVSENYDTAAFKIEDDSAGNVNIILKGNNILKSGDNCAGLQKNGDVGTLTIAGTGSLTATGGYNGAGIGGGEEKNGSNITINGGTITATSKNWGAGAGIGGGGGSKGGNGSNITISGGTVTATGDSGAGIGGGGSGGGGINGGNGSNITISGGTVTATGDSGAGIGGGGSGGGNSNGGNGSNITISGGTVNTTGGSGAGIGGGSGGSGGNDGKGSNITISGGTVTAIGDYSTGIGGGLSTTAQGGTNGNAWIVASGDSAHISNTSGSGNWSGVIFQGNEGQVYKNPSLSENAALSDGKTLTIDNGNTLTIAEDTTLTIDEGAALTNNGNIINEGTLIVDGGTLSGTGKLEGSGRFLTTTLTENMITVPTGLVYDTDIIETITEQTKAAATICEKEFEVTGWTLSVTTTDNLNYNVTYTSEKDGETITKTVKAEQSGAALTADLADKEAEYTYTDTITINATVNPTGEASTAAAMLANFEEPTAGQIAVYEGNTQVSEPQLPNENGTCTLTVAAKDIGLGEHTLTVKYIESTVMAEATETVNVTIKPAVLTITGAEINEKTYDKSTAATVSSITFSGLANGESLALGTDYTAEAAFSDENAGTGKTVTVTVTLKDTVENYTLAENEFSLDNQTINKADDPLTKPGSTKSVPNSCAKVSSVELPEGWKWSAADKDKEIALGGTVTATAYYTKTDNGNYKNIEVTIEIMRSNCEHTNKEIRNTKDATCTEEGYTGDTVCLQCGETVESGNTITPTRHSGGTATCVNCAVCDKCDTEYGEVDPKNHINTALTGAVEATCSAKGYTGDFVCTDCETVIEEGTEIAKLPHEYRSEVTKEPTVDSEGVRTYTCEKCGGSYTESIPMLTKPSDSETQEPNIPDDTDEPNTPDDTNPDDTGKPDDTNIPDDTGVLEAIGNKSKEVKAGENAPKTKVITPLNDLIEAVIPEEMRTEIKDSDTVKIVLRVEDAEETVTEEDKQAVSEVIKQMDDYKLVQHLNISLFEIINGNESKITSTSKPITLSFEIPEALRGMGREYAVIRVHENETTILNDLDDDPNTVTIETDRFSTYALAYTEKSQKNPATGAAISLIPLTLAFTALAVVTVKRKMK